MKVKEILILFTLTTVVTIVQCGKKGGQAVVVVSNQGGGKCGNAKTIVKTGGGGKKGKKGQGHTIIATSDNKCGCGGKKVVEIPLPMPVHHGHGHMMPMFDMMRRDSHQQTGVAGVEGSAGLGSGSDVRPIYVREEMSAMNGHSPHQASPLSGSSNHYDHYGSDSMAASRFLFAPPLAHPMSPLQHPFASQRIRGNPFQQQYHPGHHEMSQHMAMAASAPMFPLRGDFGGEPHPFINSFYGEPSHPERYQHRYRDADNGGDEGVEGKVRGDVGSFRPGPEAVEPLTGSGKESNSFPNISDENFSSMWPDDAQKARRRETKE